MADLTFVGAAGTVTGSKHLITTGGKHFFVDCGLFQGSPDIEALNHVPLPVDAKEIDAVVVTHGHLDHVGYLPKLVADGFRGSIYCTPATAEVMAIVLEDAASLQQHMHARGFHRERSHGLAPFYTDADVEATLAMVHKVPLETDFQVCGATMRYHGVGHIIGAAYVDMHVDGRHAIFSGDVGRYNSNLLADPVPLDGADTVICEATYGDRVHPPDSLDLLRQTIHDGIARGGTILLPSFAVERTQDMLWAIGQLQTQDSTIAPVPVHLDSPMAIKVDAVFAHHPEAYKPVPSPDGTLFGCRNLTLHVTTDESKALNSVSGPAILIASSGMATGGRVLHHLYRCLSDPRATVVFPGYEVPGTLGGLLVNHVSPVRIFGDQITVRANVVHLTGFSAHADQDELQRWLGTLKNKPQNIYLVHADPDSAAAFAAILQKDGYTAGVGRRGVTVAL